MSIAARSRRGRISGATGAPCLRLTGRLAFLIMLIALAVRLASMMPGVPVMHWHGAIAVVHAGGGYAHAYGADGCCSLGGESSEDEGNSESQTYFSMADVPVQPAADTLLLPTEDSPRGVDMVPPCVWRDAGARSPGPTRGPPRR